MQHRDVTRRFLELFALCSLTFARPVFTGFGASPGQFVLRGGGRWSVIAFVVAVLIVPPAAMQLTGAVVGLRSEWRRRIAHQLSLGGLAGLLVLELTGLGAGMPTLAVFVVLALSGTAWTLTIGARRGTEMWLKYLAWAGPVFGLLFLLLSPVSSIVLPNGAAASAAEPTGGDDRPHVVMVVLDELPTASLLDEKGEIDSRDYPNFARLAATSTWYRNHSTVSSTTAASLPALLTGQYPPEAVATPSYTEFPDTVFSLLENTHELKVTEPYTGLCPPSTCPAPDLVEQAGVARQLVGDAKQFWIDRLHRAPVKFEVPWVITEPSVAVQEFLPDLPGASDEPTMAFLHLLSPHQPWNRLGDGRPYEAPSWLFLDLAEDNTWRNEFAAAQSRVRHLQKLQYTDLLLGELLDEMETSGAWDDTMLVVVADHGISFTAHQEPRYVSPDNEPQTMWSPLFIKAPGQSSGEMTDHPVQSIDIAPTIAAEAGVDVPFEMDGAAVIADGEPNDRSYVDVDGERVPLAEAGFDEMLDLEPGRFDDSPLGLWKGGPLGELVGEPLDELASRTVGPEDGSVVVTGAERFANVDLDGDLPPVYAPGQVSDESTDEFTADDGDVVLVVVNGRIAGWSELSTIWGSPRAFGVTIPPPLLVEGPNRLEVGVVPRETTASQLASGAVEVILVPVR